MRQTSTRHVVNVRIQPTLYSIVDVVVIWQLLLNNRIYAERKGQLHAVATVAASGVLSCNCDIWDKSVLAMDGWISTVEWDAMAYWRFGNSIGSHLGTWCSYLQCVSKQNRTNYIRFFVAECLQCFITLSTSMHSGLECTPTAKWPSRSQCNLRR